MNGQPVRVAVANDYELVVVGVAGLLEPFRDRIAVVELDVGVPVARDDVDVVLYDTFGQVQGSSVDIGALVDGTEAKVVIYSWNVQPELVQKSLARGVAGYLSKALDAESLVSAIEQVHAGVVVTPGDGDTGQAELGAWPGQQYGLSVRESEILALITQGLSNKEIAERSYLSINSVKTYIRTGYRKIGVVRRSQAVLWGIQHGFEPDVVRRVDAQR